MAMRAGGARQLVRIRNISYSDWIDCMLHGNGRKLGLPLAEVEPDSTTAPASCVWLNMTDGTVAFQCRRQVACLA